VNFVEYFAIEFVVLFDDCVRYRRIAYHRLALGRRYYWRIIKNYRLWMKRWWIDAENILVNVIKFRPCLGQYRVAIVFFIALVVFLLLNRNQNSFGEFCVAFEW